MGLCKNYLAEVSSRGYDDSDKYVCSICVGDKYLYSMIRSEGTRGTCSFCHKHRNVLPMNKILAIISEAIRRNYISAEGNAIYDSEEKQWMDYENVIDPYDFVYDELNMYLESDSDEFLKELLDKLVFEDRMRKSYFFESQEQIDLMAWTEYCNLVRNTALSAEQIVGLISNDNEKKIPEKLKNIQAILNMIYEYCKDLDLAEILDGINNKNGGTAIYRCVNFLPAEVNIEGISFIPATVVGTAPAKKVADNRMSEKGDMMFYGADDINTACKEVGRNLEHPEYPATVGVFYANKKFRILDLSCIPRDKLPSIFDVGNEYKRRAWCFINEFVKQVSKSNNRISKYNSTNRDGFYKPTQVFTKYIQRNTDFKGIKFKSSKTVGNCYVIFVENRDCIDYNDKVNKNRNQLIMKKCKQVDFFKQETFGSINYKMHYDENKNGIYDLTEDEQECIIHHQKFYSDFFRFGNLVLDSFPDPIKDYELTIYSMYYRIIELLDTLEEMTVCSLINSSFLIVRSLLEAVGMLCYVLCDNNEIEKKAIIWQMMDIKRTFKDEKIYYQEMSKRSCYKQYVSNIKNSKKEYNNWYSYCEGKKTSIVDIFKKAGLEDLYINLYKPLCFENHEVNHMETNIDCINGKFYFKPFRNFENHVLLLNSVIRAMLPVNDKMVYRYGNEKLKNEWNVYKNKATRYVESNEKITDVEKIFNPLIKWF